MKCTIPCLERTIAGSFCTPAASSLTASSNACSVFFALPPCQSEGCPHTEHVCSSLEPVWTSAVRRDARRRATPAWPWAGSHWTGKTNSPASSGRSPQGGKEGLAEGAAAEGAVRISSREDGTIPIVLPVAPYACRGSRRPSRPWTRRGASRRPRRRVVLPPSPRRRLRLRPPPRNRGL